MNIKDFRELLDPAHLEPKLPSKLSITRATYSNSLYGLSHFELLAKGRFLTSVRIYFIMIHSKLFMVYHRAEQYISFHVGFFFFSGFWKLMIISTCRILHMHILNSFHILVSDLVFHSGLESFSAVNLHLLRGLSWVEPPVAWIPWLLLFWITPGSCWNIFSVFSVKEFQAGKLPREGLNS